MKRSSILMFLFGLWLNNTQPLQAATLYNQISPGEPIGAFSSVDIPIIGQGIAANFALKHGISSFLWAM